VAKARFPTHFTHCFASPLSKIVARHGMLAGCSTDNKNIGFELRGVSALQ
jgi:hypothetical protein